MNPTSAAPLLCARPGCAHAYAGEHAPGGGNCMVWDPVSGEHCLCRGYQWVRLSSTPARHSGHAS